MRLFVYGTLLAPATLARRAGTPGLRHIGSATLPNHCRVGIPRLRWPTLRRARNTAVTGAIVTAPARAVGRLAAWEGPEYVLRRVVVATPRGNCAAWCWIAPRATRRPPGAQWRG